MKVGFIGIGNMGASLAKIVIEVVDAKNLLLANRSPQKLEQFISDYGGQATDNREIFETCDYIFLGVKPAQYQPLLAEYASVLQKRDSILFFSMAAGLTLAKLQTFVPNHHRFIRLMPNTPVSIGDGVVSYTLSENCNQGDEERLQQFLGNSGELIRLNEELMDVATGVAGCGPAFVYLFIEALADAGVKNGLPRDIALKMAAQTVSGAGQMVLKTNHHPGLLKDQVCSPGGSTIAGIASLESGAFRGCVIEAVDIAYKRTQELGK
ncbi:Pyrroline-5-carboxylate reductase [Streptococcus sp. DD10]|uniref:pyrroline-5-carboxylate reductase n=1 Tax=Streptococcus sp. DD10 TaxID=1777878 RepID=UPI000793B5D9|nr:pyrroline-5-carboxylate reductase [Streptococcus sp. DD10]KXT75156.1 Pyrroline-5-carboxylate reductase [Streptococcus sp. DD10]